MGKEEDYKELYSLLMKSYHVFYEILKTGNALEKIRAFDSFNTINQMMKEKIGEYEDLHQIRFEDMDRLLSDDKEIHNEEIAELQKDFLEMKTAFSEMKEKAAPLVETTKEELGLQKPKSKRRRGRKMTRNLRAKG